MKARKIFTIIVGIIMFITAFWNIITFSLSAANYTKNKLLWDEDTQIISYQSSKNVANLKYGFGTIGANGCGAVAIYNIMYTENRKVSLPDIIKYMDNGQFFFGLLGTSPQRIMNYLKLQGFSCSISSDKSKFDQLAQEGDYSIYMYVGISDGRPVGHYTLLIPNSDSTFKVINSGNRVMTMQQLIDENSKYFINSLITVSK